MVVTIKVDNLSKQYRLGEMGTGTISHDLNRWWHKIRGKEDPYIKIGEVNDRTLTANSDYVWSLRDVSFELGQGEVLGIIGRNGAGKSTLLKLLSRTTAPTHGSIKIKGRVASLLEVGTGFHPELTGRENVFLNGAILGMTEREVKIKFDQIVDFSGVERYIDTPVKRYSSGMYVRLAFAVAAHLEPEILIVDEVLAVGDAEFQAKCLGKIKDVSVKEGRTVLFVSHNLNSIVNLCQKGLVLKNGMTDYWGNASGAVDYYIKSNVNKGSLNYISSNLLTSKINSIRIHHISHTNTSESFGFNETVIVECSVQLNEKITSGLHLGIAVLDRWHKKVFTTVHELVESYFSSGYAVMKMTIPNRTLLSGIYFIDAALFVPNGSTIEYLSEICMFEIVDIESDLALFQGNDIGGVNVECLWEVG